jgi:adenylylsulfate kinase
MAHLFPVLWLTGNTDAGKTTLAYGLKNAYDARPESPLYHRIVVLDGDEMRSSISTEESLSAADRRRHNLRVARLAAVLRQQGFLVIIAVIAPFASVRDEVDAICNPLWIYVKRTLPASVDKPYEPPAKPHCTVDNDAMGIDEALRAGCEFVEGMLKGVGSSTSLPAGRQARSHSPRIIKTAYA